MINNIVGKYNQNTMDKLYNNRSNSVCPKIVSNYSTSQKNKDLPGPNKLVIKKIKYPNKSIEDKP